MRMPNGVGFRQKIKARKMSRLQNEVQVQRERKRCANVHLQGKRPRQNGKDTRGKLWNGMTKYVRYAESWTKGSILRKRMGGLYARSAKTKCNCLNIAK